MRFFTQQGRALLLVVIFAVGVVWLAGCGGSGAAEKMKVAHMVLMQFESSVLAAVADGINNPTKRDLALLPPEDDNWFVFTINEDPISCTVTAKMDIGNFKKGSSITSKYDKTRDSFVHSSSQAAEAQKMIPAFFAGQSGSGETSGGGGKADTQAQQSKSAAHWQKESAKNEWGEESGYYYIQRVNSEGMDENVPNNWVLAVGYYGNNIVGVTVGKMWTAGDDDGSAVVVTLRDEGGTETQFIGNIMKAAGSFQECAVIFDDIDFVQALQKNANYKILVKQSEGHWYARASIKGSLPTK